MAQIVTITNPLTGQPAQVDQLEHTAQQIDDAIARAIPGGAIDIALQKKAPAGYGLGGDAKFITSGDLNDYKNCGWYAWDEGVSHAPFPYGSCIILNKGGSWIVHQIAIAGYGQNICIRRYLTPTDTWDAWEWVNPPMKLGVEYRTTERYQGKPVYKRLIDFGTLPNSGVKEVSVPDAGNVMRDISIDLSKSVCTKTGYLDTNLFPYHPSISGFYFNIGTVRIETTNDYSSWSAKICISYTKSTD